MRLVACPGCHAQYDVSDLAVESFACRCGSQVENRPLQAVDAEIHRCGACGALVAAEAESCEYCTSEIVRDDGALSLICPECYARCAEDARFCTACGVGFRPEPLPAEGQERPCPACEALMPPRAVGGVSLNECPKCNGLWVPEDGFDALLDRAIQARQGADPARLAELRPRVTGSNPARQRVQYRKCPDCDGFMQRRNFGKSSGVIVDRCCDHGTWLDADELEQIAGFVLGGGPRETFHHRSQGEARAAAAFTRIVAQERKGIFRPRDEGPGGFSLLDVLTSLLD